MPSVKRPILDGTMLRQRLAALRRRLRLVATVRGTGFLLTVVLATAVIAGLLDWHWHLPALIRALVLVGTLCGSIVVAYRYLYQPLSAPSDDLSLALRVEEQYPALNDALASTVQFLDRGTPPDASSAVLEREAVKRALGHVVGCDFSKVVNKRGLLWAGALGSVFTILTLTFLVLSPAMAGTAFLRLANPFGNIDWPKKTQLEIEEPRARIGRNEIFEVRGTVRGVIPPKAVIVFRSEGFFNLEHHCDIKVDDSGVGHLSTRFDAGQVRRNFHFQVKANDAASREYAIEVLPPPSLVALDSKPSPQLQLFFPRYTRLPSPETLSPGSGTIDAVVGTAVRLRARADRPLRRAWVEFQPEKERVVLGDLLALMSGGLPWWEPVPAVLDADRCTFTIDFTPTLNGNYALYYEDETGLRDRKLYELRLHEDPSPAVNMMRPSASRDILTVLPTAELNLEVQTDDPQYGIRSVYLEYRTQRDEPSRRLYLFEPAGGPALLVAPWSGPAVLAVPSLKTQPQRLAFRQKLLLQRLHHADGSSLKEEDIVYLRACGDDFDDVNPNKEPGHSAEVEIRIVGRNALDLALNQEQAGVQQELLHMLEKEREALQKVTEAENHLKKNDKLSAEDQEKLLQAEQLQQQIRDRAGTEEKGLRSDVKRILDSLKHNGMEKTAAEDRMKDVAREMDRLAENELQQIEPRLTNVRKLAELLDEKNREERKAQLESRAREAEQEAKTAEEAAGSKDGEAAEAEKKAQQSSNNADKVRQQQEARRQRERAEELRQKARELRARAERDRQDANQRRDPAELRKDLADARKSQEEVEKTLNDLLTRRLEPWTSSHEIKGEANRLLEEQKRLQAEVEKLAGQQEKNGAAGKAPAELTREQQADLDNLKQAQQKLEERTRQLLEKMDRVAAQREEKDPETARELRDALEGAKQDNIEAQMREARENIEKNQLNDAHEKQRASVENLKKLARNLEDRREAELERLAKKLRDREKELAELIKEQEELRKKVKEAGQIGDPAKREEELKRLAGRQEQLRKKTEEMVRHLTRMRASRAGETLGRAGEQMAGAGQQMQDGQQGEDEQEQTLERLNEAQQELQRARKEAEEELGREQIIRLADLIKPLKERQEALTAETTRLQERVQQKKKWERPLRIDFSRKGEAQTGLGTETAELAEKRLSKAPVFARLMRRAGEAMTEAGERMNTVAKDAVDPKDLPDAETARLQQLAQRRLTQVVDALKEAAEKMEQARAGGGGGGGGEGGDNAAKAAPPSDGIPPLAQLKLLRDLQKDINQRTETFRKEHPDPKKLPKKAQGVLESIRKDQQDVAELIDELNRPAGEPGDAEGDKR